jgi:hypothetical protein
VLNEDGRSSWFCFCFSFDEVKLSVSNTVGIDLVTNVYRAVVHFVLSLACNQIYLLNDGTDGLLL